MIGERALAWANGHAPDRAVAVGRLAVRALHYVAQGLPAAVPPIPGLQVAVYRQSEQPLYHGETGVYGFLRLAPGPARIELSDAAGRWFPAVRSFVIPDREPVRAALGAGGTPAAEPPGPGGLPAWIAEIAMRPAIGMPAVPGLTTLWGVVREASGAPIPLARIEVESVGGIRIVAHSDAGGTWLMTMPSEKTDPLTLTSLFPRAVRVHTPREPLAAAIRTSRRFVAALPADFDTLNPDAPGSPFQLRTILLQPAGGGAAIAPPLPVQAGARNRWDIIAQP